ncbi:MFS transporter [Pedobacter sp. NJ-S-72]
MKIKGLRWYIIALISLATVINYIDRSAINIMWPYIYKEFGIAAADNKNALALITTFFMIAYALGQTFTGKLMDAVGTRLGMTISIIGWSVSIALHSFARSLLSFNIFRFMLGFSEAGNWPGATKSNAEWFPVKERAIAQGIFGAGSVLRRISDLRSGYCLSLYRFWLEDDICVHCRTRIDLGYSMADY